MKKKRDLSEWQRAIAKIRQAIGGILGNSEQRFWNFMRTKQAGLDGLSPVEYLKINGKNGVARILDFVEGSKSGEMS